MLCAGLFEIMFFASLVSGIPKIIPGSKIVTKGQKLKVKLCDRPFISKCLNFLLQNDFFILRLGICCIYCDIGFAYLEIEMWLC